MAFLGNLADPLNLADAVRNRHHPSTRGHLMVTFKMFLVTFWAFHGYALWHDHMSHQEYDLHNPTARHEWRYFFTTDSSEPWLMYLELTTVGVYIFLTIVGLGATFLEDWAQTLTVASFWSVTLAVDIISHLIGHVSLVRFHFYVSGLLLVILWLYAACLDTVSDKHIRSTRSQIKPSARLLRTSISETL